MEYYIIFVIILTILSDMIVTGYIKVNNKIIYRIFYIIHLLILLFLILIGVIFSLFTLNSIFKNNKNK